APAAFFVTSSSGPDARLVYATTAGEVVLLNGQGDIVVRRKVESSFYVGTVIGCVTDDRILLLSGTAEVEADLLDRDGNVLAVRPAGLRRGNGGISWWDPVAGDANGFLLIHDDGTPSVVSAYRLDANGMFDSHVLRLLSGDTSGKHQFYRTAVVREPNRYV